MESQRNGVARGRHDNSEVNKPVCLAAGAGDLCCSRSTRSRKGGMSGGRKSQSRSKSVNGIGKECSFPEH